MYSPICRQASCGRWRKKASDKSPFSAARWPCGEAGVNGDRIILAQTNSSASRVPPSSPARGPDKPPCHRAVCTAFLVSRFQQRHAAAGEIATADAAAKEHVAAEDDDRLVAHQEHDVPRRMARNFATSRAIPANVPRIALVHQPIRGRALDRHAERALRFRSASVSIGASPAPMISGASG